MVASAGTAEMPWQDEDFSSALVALLHDERFQRFMQEAPYDYDRDASADGYAPCGLSGELAQELVGFARRMRGMPFVSAGEANNAFWVVSPAMQRDLFALVSRTSATSDLWRSLGEMLDRREMRRFVANDLEAAAVRDGIAVDREAIQAIACDGREPQTPAEALVARALEHARAGVSQLEGLGDLEGLWLRLTAGFEDVASHSRYRMPVHEMLGGRHWNPPQLSDLWTCINNVDQREVHPLLGVLFASDMVFDAEPFARFNALTEFVLRSMLLDRWGMPALRFVPLSALRLDWELGIQPHLYNRPYGKAVTPGPYGVDSTLMLRESIGFLKQGVARLEEAVAVVAREDARRCEAVEADWRLNVRHKELLCELVRHPEQTVDALAYERRFGVAMSTAHTDLATLARLGFVDAQTVGRKQVYRLDKKAFARG